MIGAITNLPVLLLGVASVLGSVVIGRLGTRRAVIAGLVVEAVAGALRGVGSDVAVLFACTFAMGIGIAVLQPALPTLCREWRPEAVGTATALYGNGLLVGEALAASVTLPVLLKVTGSWPASLALWSAPVAFAVVLALGVDAGMPGSQRGSSADLPGAEPGAEGGPSRPSIPARPRWPNWKDGLTWRLGLIQGGASTVYFAANAFLPGYLHATGHGNLVGAALAALNISQLPASALLLVYAHRLVGRRWPLVTLALVLIGASAGLLVAPAPVMLVLVGVTGFTTASMLLLTLALPAALSSPAEVAPLSAGMFTIGYSMAFLLPLLGGLASDATSSIRLTLLPALAGAAIATLAAAPGSLERAGELKYLRRYQASKDTRQL